MREQHLQQWPGQDGINGPGAPAHGVGEYRLMVEQFAGHSRILTALPGEEPCCGGRVGAFTAQHSRPLPVRHQIVEPHPYLVQGIGNHCGTVLEMRPSRAGGETDICQCDPGVLREPIGVPLCQRDQALGRARRQRQHSALLVSAFIAGDLSCVVAEVVDDHQVRRLFDQHMRIGAGEPERTDARPSRSVGDRPGCGLVDDVHRQGGPWNMR